MKHRKIISILLVLLLLLGLLPAAVLAKDGGDGSDSEEPYVFTEEDDEQLNRDVFADIRTAQEDYAEERFIESGKKAGDPRDISSLTEQDYIDLIPQVIEAIENSETYVEGSLQENGCFLVWETTTGIPCCYDPDMEARLNNPQVEEEPTEVYGMEKADLLEASPLQAIRPYSSGIGYLAPMYKDANHYYDENFATNHTEFSNMWTSLCNTVSGGTNYFYTTDDVTVGSIAKTIEECGLVLINSHGATDYNDGQGDKTTRANCSYICINSNKGFTSEDTKAQTGPFGTYYHALKSGKYYLVSGTAITNHMTKNAPASFVWLGMCLSMATDGLCAPLRAKGVEAVFGFSQPVTFGGDRTYMTNVVGSLRDGASLVKAVLEAKENVGYWDNSDDYTTLETARQNHCAFPIVVSSVDAYPGQGNVDNYQTVRSDWRLDPTALTFSGTAKIDTSSFIGQELSVTLSGKAVYFAESELAFQWQINKGGTWSDISGATESTYTCTWDDDYRNIRVVVTAPGYDGSITSNSCYVRGGVELTEENFPDPVFRQYLADTYDKDNDGVLDAIEEIDDLSEIHLGGTEVASLEGLSNLYNVVWVYANHTKITSFDGSGCYMLRVLDLSECPLDSLDVSDNFNLEKLYLADITGSLKDLDLSGHKYLEELEFYRSKDLYYVDISDCPLLVDAVLYGTEEESSYYKCFTADSGAYLAMSIYGTIEDIYVAHFDKAFPSEQFRKEVQKLCDWDENGLLDHSEAKYVTSLFPEDDEELVTTLEGIEFFPNLDYLSAFNCRIDFINLSKNVNLTHVDLAANRMRTIDVSNLDKLEYLNLDYNDLEFVNVSNNSALKELDISGNQLISINVSHNPKLTVLDISENEIETLDISKNTKLTNLNVGETKITSLDLTKHSELYNLCIAMTDIQSLDLSKNSKLNYLYAGNSGLKSLDISNNPKLRCLFLNDTGLSTLDISNNAYLKTAYAEGKKELSGAAYDFYRATGIYAEMGVDPATRILIGNLKNAKIAAVADQTYTGAAIKPAVKVTLDGKTLKKGTDYTVSYTSNTNVGTAAIKVTGKGSYGGTKSATFKITQKEITPTITLTSTSYVYDGKARTPGVTVKDGDKTLKKDTDYTISWPSGRKNVGSYKVTVTLKGNYKGSASKTFKITAKSITPAVALSTTSCTYNGKVRTPTVTVKDGETVLTADTDYTVAYASGRKYVGTYKVTVTLKGNYSGSGTASFTIKKARQPMTAKARTVTLKASRLKKKALTVKISKAVTIKKAKGTKTFKITSKGKLKKIKIDKKTGRITVPKGTGKGTYKIKIKIIAAGGKNYKKGSKTVKVTIKVK